MTWLEDVFGKWVVKNRWWIIIATVLIVAAASSGARSLTFNTGFTICMALLADFLLAPAMMVLLSRTKGQNNNVQG